MKKDNKTPIENKSREHLIREVAREAARQAVHETFLAIGIDSNKPQDFQEDMVYLKHLREGREFIYMRIKSVIIAVIIPTILYLLWQVLLNSLQK